MIDYVILLLLFFFIFDAHNTALVEVFLLDYTASLDRTRFNDSDEAGVFCFIANKNNDNKHYD